VGTQPGLQAIGATAGQHVDPLAGLGVGEDGGVTVAALESEVIDTQHSRDPQRWQRQPHEHSKCRAESRSFDGAMIPSSAVSQRRL
jgi:hypothetical protein